MIKTDLYEKAISLVTEATAAPVAAPSGGKDDLKKAIANIIIQECNCEPESASKAAERISKIFYGQFKN